jgi:hypothetical protein
MTGREAVTARALVRRLERSRNRLAFAKASREQAERRETEAALALADALEQLERLAHLR